MSSLELLAAGVKKVEANPISVLTDVIELHQGTKSTGNVSLGLGISVDHRVSAVFLDLNVAIFRLNVTRVVIVPEIDGSSRSTAPPLELIRIISVGSSGIGVRPVVDIAVLVQNAPNLRVRRVLDLKLCAVYDGHLRVQGIIGNILGQTGDSPS